MRILFRHVLTAFLLPLAYCLATFMALYIVIELIDAFPAILVAKPSWRTVALYFAGYIAPFFDWLLAAALLLAALYTTWRLCRYGEITAMRANGLGLRTIVAPMVAVALAGSVIAAFNLEFFAPAAAEFTKNIEKSQFKAHGSDIRENLNYYNVNKRRIWRLNRVDLYQPQKIDGAQITFERADGTRELDISCKSAAYLDGMWWLSHPRYTWYDEMGMMRDARQPQLAALVLRPMPELNETPTDFVNETRDWGLLSVRARLRYLRVHPNLSHAERDAKWYDIHYRLAAPWSGVIITLFAIPMGIATGRQSVVRGILTAIGLFFAFFATVNVGMILAKKELLPPFVGAWMAHVVFLATGLVLLWRQR